MEIDYLSHLPLETQLLILQNLNYVEFSRFNAVCKDWRSIASDARQRPSSRLQQVPWLIHKVSSRRQLSHHKNILFKFEFSLYSSSFIYLHSQGLLLSHRRIMELFDLHDFNSICGSSQGWLLITQSSPAYSNFLLDPRTRRRISLPKSTFANFVVNPLTRQRISLPENPKYSDLEAGVILPYDGSITVVAYFQNDWFYYCNSSHDEHWTEINRNGKSSTMISDMIYHKGDIYAVNNYSYTGVFIIRPDCCRKAPSPLKGYTFRPRFIHLVECDSDLLMVVRAHESDEAVPEVSVFKYIINPKGWGKVTSIGDKYALLVGKGNSMSVDVSTNSSTSFRANCVYYLDYESGRKGIGCFDLGKNTFGTFVPYGWTGEVTTPTWFMPSLTWTFSVPPSVSSVPSFLEAL